MTEPEQLPKRLVDEGDPFESALLRGARAYQPDPAARAHTLAALGLASGATVAVGATAAKGGLGWLLRTVTGKIVLSVIACGLIGGSVLVATHYARRSERAAVAPASSTTIAIAERPVTPPSAPSAAPIASVTSDTTIATSPVVASASASASQVPPPLATARPTDPSASSSAPSKADLAGEAALLDRARTALGAGDPAAALAALDEHRRGFPRPMLGIEAQVLRIEALARQGNGAQAKSLGEAFLARNPDSPHAARVRSLIKDL
jgi:hypothetical protein